MDKFITPGIKIGIRALEAQIDEKNKNIEARQNVTSSYKKNSALWSKIKSLHRMGKIFSYFVSNGTVKIKIQETSINNAYK